jgi:hypothetical protein
MLIVVLAANTSFADFPRLSSLLSRDRYASRQFGKRGDRLVFSNGILILGGLAALLLIIFRGETHALIPLYAVGVFLSFTLSQGGMIRHWLTAGGPGWRWRLAVNGTGAVVTGVVTLVIAVTKFTHGAWMVVLLIPILVMAFKAVHRHYEAVASELSLTGCGGLGGKIGATCRPVCPPLCYPAADEVVMDLARGTESDGRVDRRKRALTVYLDLGTRDQQPHDRPGHVHDRDRGHDHLALVRDSTVGARRDRPPVDRFGGGLHQPTSRWTES